MTAPDAAQQTRLPRRKLALALAMLIGGGVTWGVTFSLAKLVMEAGVHPYGLSWLNAALGAALLLPYCLVRFGGIPFRLDYLRVYVIAGTLGTAFPSCILFLAAAEVPAGVLAIITSTVPLFTYGFALLVRIERLTWRRLIGILLGFSAMLLIVAPDASLPARAMAAWVVLALLAPLSYSAENVYIALRRPFGSSPFVLLCGMLLAGTALLTPLVWATDTWVPLWHPWTVVEWSMLVLILVNLLGYLVFLELIVLAGPLFAAQTGYLVTASGVFWGIIILAETHSAWVWAALGLIFAGVALVNPRTAREGAAENAGEHAGEHNGPS